MMQLRYEEQLICRWLTEYGALPREQVYRLLYQKSRGTVEKIIRGLQKEHYIAYVSKGRYLGLDSQSQPDLKLISAIWVLLHFIEKIELENHCRGNYPAQLFFLKEGIGYEVVVLSHGEEYLSKLLRPAENQKYIFVVSDTEAAKRVFLPAAPCLFAVLHYSETEPVPDIQFYTPEGIHRGSG